MNICMLSATQRTQRTQERMPMVDRRLVQTAVLGSAESEDPVTLPTDCHEVDEFRAEFEGATFWCGVKLSGCGRKLITKRYPVFTVIRSTK